MTGDLNSRLSRLSKQQRANLLSRLRSEAEPQLRQRPRERLMVPSFQQEQMWFVDRLASGRARNNSNQALRMRGHLDVAALRAAVAALVDRHEILRTTLTEVDGSGWQVIHPRVVIEVPIEDLSEVAEAERSERLEAVRKEHTNRGFDLDRGPLARALLVRLGPENHLLFWCAHHIIWDPGSRQVFFTELLELYSAQLENRQPRLCELPVQYADFAAWQQERISGERGAGLREFWARRLSGLGVFEVPPDRPRPPEMRFRGTRIDRETGDDLLARVRTFSRRHNATQFMTLLAALDVLLFRLTGEADVSVATASMIRRRDELKRLLGCFVNMVVLRVDLSGDPTFAELVERVRDVVLEAFSHEELPFEKVVDAVNPPRDPSRNPLFQIEFTTSARDGEPRLSAAGLEVEVVPVPDEVSRFDMSVMTNDYDGLTLMIEYDTDLYEPATIEGLLDRFELLLRDAVEHPDTRISELRISSTVEDFSLTGVWSRGPDGPEMNTTLDRMFGQQVEVNPDRPAVVCGGQTLTYAELDRRVDRLARHLRDLGVGPGCRVGVCVNRSAEAVVAVLGVLRAGGAYVPIDPASPPRRMRDILADSGAYAVIGDAAALSERPLEHTILLDQDPLSGADRPIEPTAAPEDLAYVIYTSGTMGTPKGVMVEHRSVVAFVRSITAAYEITSADRVIQFASLAFDVSVFDVFAALLNGATLVIATEDEKHDPWRLTALLRDQRVTVAELPPALLPSLDPAGVPDLRLLSLGGEPFPAALAAAWSRPGRRVINGYGPTETTVAVTLMDCEGARGSSPPIGRPLAGHQTLVLDDAGRPAPVGVPGELCVAGPGVARGYLGRPGLTAQRFVPNPYARVPGERMYRTGDLVRWLPDRDLEFLGRRDRQIKVRGFRVEPQEIESVLLAFPRVRGATVEPYRKGEQCELVAYVEADDTGGVREYLAERLPGHMVPAHVVAVPQIPRTSAGKVDRAALPVPDGRRAKTDVGREPRDDVERRLAKEVFGDLLGVDNVDVSDDFFELGGNSLHATRLLARVGTMFGVRLGLADFFADPTVAGLAERVRAAKRPAGSEDRLSRYLDSVEQLPEDEVHDLLRLLEEAPR